MRLNELPPPTLYGVPLDRIIPGTANQARTRYIYTAIRRYKAAASAAGHAGGTWEHPRDAEAHWYLARLRQHFSSENSVSAKYGLFARAVQETRAALGLAPLHLQLPKRAPRRPRPSLTPAQEHVLRGFSISEIRRITAEFEDAFEARAWALVAGAPRTRDPCDMDYNELIRDIVNRRGGVLSKTMADIGPLKFRRLLRRHGDGWRRIACLRGPYLRDWIAFRLFLVLEAAINECVLDALKTDALQGAWLGGIKRRKNNGGEIHQLIKSRPPFSVAETFDAARRVRRLLSEDAPSQIADDLFLFRCRETRRVRSFAAFNVEQHPWTAETVRLVLDDCGRRTGVSFDGISSMNVRATAIRRIVDEEATLDDAMLRTGHDSLDVLLGYLEPDERARVLGLNGASFDFHETLLDAAAELFSHSGQIGPEAFQALADQRFDSARGMS
jgi:hypothetical protein